MDELPGAMGTSAGLALRLGQASFAIASLLFMCLEIQFYSYTSFCFLVIVMALIVPWSLTLGIVDIVTIFFKRSSRRSGLLAIVVVGDWVLAFLSLAASSSSSGVTSLLVSSQGFCDRKLCARYQLSSAMAFLSWFFSFNSALFNLWILLS
ncbi:hypothetical protein M569_02306, partial [Genlisea aurea]